MTPDNHHSSTAGTVETRARELFDTSVEALDAATLARLRESRQAALHAATKQRTRARHWAWTWGPVGALAAGIVGAVLLLRAPMTTQTSPVAATPPQDETLELLAAGEDLDLATEADLDFYEWIAVASPTTDDGVG